MKMFLGPLRWLSSFAARIRTAFFVLKLRARAVATGSTVRIGGNFSVGRNVRISLLRNSSLEIGDDVLMGEFTRIIVGEGGKLSIGSGTSFTGFDTIYANRDVRIGSKNAFAVHVLVTDANHHFSDARRNIVDCGCSYGAVRIDDDVWIGAYTVVLPGVSIGRHSVVGANSTVTRDVPARSVAVGSPARVMRRLGMK